MTDDKNERTRRASTSKPEGERTRCTAYTRNNDQCRNMARPGKTTCPIHGLTAADPAPLQNRTKW
jgi:hypothetical protein